MTNYHVVLVDKKERNIKAESATVVNGALVLNNADGATAVIYAAGAWVACERELYDDKGYPTEDAEPKKKK